MSERYKRLRPVVWALVSRPIVVMVEERDAA